MNNIKPDFTKSPDGLLPAIIQDSITKNILMLGYMNQEAFNQSNKENRVTFFSRSKQRLWTKGETSGNYLDITEIQLDCDQDTLLVKVKPAGPVCHQGTDTCFQKENKAADLGFLEDVILDRIANPQKGSYTNSLIDRGINKVAQKVGEEAVELVIEAKDDNDELFLNEAADLLYHLTVLLGVKKKTYGDVIDILLKRYKKTA